MCLITELLPTEPLTVWLERIKSKKLLIQKTNYDIETLAILLSAIFQYIPLPCIFMNTTKDKENTLYRVINGDEILSALYDFYLGREIPSNLLTPIFPDEKRIVNYSTLSPNHIVAFRRCNIIAYKTYSLDGDIKTHTQNTLAALYPSITTPLATTTLEKPNGNL